MSDVVKLFLGSYLLMFSLFLVTDAAITSPLDQEACVGDDVTIPWEYNDTDTDIGSVIWSVNTTTDIMTYFGSGGTRNPVGGYNVVSSSDRGSITITSASRSNSGTYKMEVIATQSTFDEVEVLICDAADTSQLKGTKSGSEWKCESSNLGDPEAEIYIKVDGKKQTSSSANVTSFENVECCLNGCAVKCTNIGTSEYCIEVQTPPGPGKRCWCVCKDEEWKCFICWFIIILVSEIITGLIIGCCMIYQPGALEGCLNCEASDCADCCQPCDNNIIRCECCCSCWNIEKAPFWYYILWWTGIGTPVAFGIFIVMKLKQPTQKHEDGNPVAIHLQNTKN